MSLTLEGFTEALAEMRERAKAQEALPFFPQPWEYTAQMELQDRLNLIINGRDPGVPINWRGLP